MASANARQSNNHDPAGDADDQDAACLRAYAQDGDVAAFERLYRRHERPMFRFLLRAAGQAELAEDLLSETWLAVCRQAGAYRVVEGARLRTWLYTIAHHKLMDHWRKRELEQGAATTLAARALALNNGAGPAAGDGDGDGDNLEPYLAADRRAEPLARLEQRECARALLAAVQALPLEQREAWLLQAEGGLSLEQIASVTAVGIETAKSRLRYARARLRRSLAEWRPMTASAVGGDDEDGAHEGGATAKAARAP